MLNLTLASLTLISLNSYSPFRTIYNNQMSPLHTQMTNCNFFKSFSPILFSSTSFHNTFLTDSMFSKMLKGAIYFNSEIDNCQKSIWEGDEYTNRTTQTDGGCHSLIIVRCTFKDIKNGNENGGAIYCQQQIYATISETQFVQCYVSTNKYGGAIYLVQSIGSNGGTDFTDGLAPELIIQYCCFDQIQTAKYGVCVYSAASQTTLYFASSVGCSTDRGFNIYGAQYDLQADNINSEYANITGSKSVYCGGIEYRRATNGKFQYQTFTGMECAFGTAFTNMQDGLKIEIQYCNFYNNKIQKYQDKIQQDIIPSLVHVKTDNIIITSFYFISNAFHDGGKFVGYETNKEDNFTIQLNNCYADCVINVPSQHVQITKCQFDTSHKTTMEMDQLNLGNCEGFKTPEPMVVASTAFSQSNSFTQSAVFTKSQSFVQTSGFTKSSVFADSSHFTKSQSFTGSHTFSASKVFTKSKSFTKSHLFSSSEKFTKSSKFTNSFTFSPSKAFTKSHSFTQSSLFTPSNGFTSSRSFTPSNHFDQTGTFTQSSFFSKSNQFTPSTPFSSSKHFTKSNSFTKSHSFTPSSKFTRSNVFTLSDNFTQSNHFTFSEKFTESETFDLPPPPPDDLITEPTKSGVSLPMIAGVAGAVAAAIAAVIIVVVVKKKKDAMHLDVVEPETIEQETASFVNNNPLFNEMDNDDPFKDDFHGTTVL